MNDFRHLIIKSGDHDNIGSGKAG